MRASHGSPENTRRTTPGRATVSLSASSRPRFLSLPSESKDRHGMVHVLTDIARMMCQPVPSTFHTGYLTCPESGSGRQAGECSRCGCGGAYREPGTIHVPSRRYTAPSRRRSSQLSGFSRWCAGPTTSGPGEEWIAKRGFAARYCAIHSSSTCLRTRPCPPGQPALPVRTIPAAKDGGGYWTFVPVGE
jgi:hypothetical protein